MPIAPLDWCGTDVKLFYTDTGPVNSKDYTTLVAYHGSAFTGYTFNKLLPLVHSSNIRLVIITRRDYDSHDENESPGSTPYTDNDREDIQAGRDAFLLRAGLEVANFILWFAETHNIPKISNDGKSGGICIIGWSLGSLHTLALLAHPDAVSAESKPKLASYFRQFILYNPAWAILGYDLSKEDTATLDTFALWASSYYINPDLTSSDGARATTVDSSRQPSFLTMTAEEVAVNFDITAVLKTDLSIMMHMRSALEKQTQGALFDETIVKEFLPALQIIWFGCPQSMWSLERARVLIEREFEEHIRQGHQLRPIKFVSIDGANHFVHWDEPRKFWEATVDVISGQKL